MEMEDALATADAFHIDDASCAVTQFCTNIHETGFLHGHTHYTTVPLRKKLAHNARSHARPFTCSTPIRFTLNARSRMRTFSFVRHSTGTL